MTSPQKRGILERLDAGEVVIGDGGFVFALEKRGYVQAGPWTPEANVEHPSAGKNFANLKLKTQRLFLKRKLILSYEVNVASLFQYCN